MRLRTETQRTSLIDDYLLTWVEAFLIDSVATTQKYLDLSLDLDNTASDFVPLSGD